MSVVVPTERLLLRTTPAPMTGAPVPSITLPLTVILLCPNAKTEETSISRAENVKKSFVNFFIIGYFVVIKIV
ncbi:MAG: hypothetical protein ACI3Y1_06550 [Candidatus Cryptobacteroides sp.]